MIKPKHAPYEGTTVPAEKSLNEIQKMLLDYGCDAVQIHRESSGRVIIRFSLEVETRGVRRKIGIELEPPMLTRKRAIPGEREWSQGRYRNKTIVEPDVDRSMRCAFWYLKSKLESIASGMVTAEKEFFAQTMVKLPSGETGTVGGFVEDSLEKGAGYFLPGLGQKQLSLPAPEKGDGA